MEEQQSRLGQVVRAEEEAHHLMALAAVAGHQKKAVVEAVEQQKKEAEAAGVLQMKAAAEEPVVPTQMECSALALVQSEEEEVVESRHFDVLPGEAEEEMELKVELAQMGFWEEVVEARRS